MKANPRNYLVIFLAFVIVLVMVNLANHVIHDYIISFHRIDGHFIDQAGSRRYLSQQIAALALGLGRLDGDRERVERLRESATRLERVHASLAPRAGALSDEAAALHRDLDPLVTRFVEDARRLADGRAAPEVSILERLVVDGDRILLLSDRITERLARDEAIWMEERESVLHALFVGEIALTIMIGLIVFLPMLRQMRSQIAELNLREQQRRLFVRTVSHELRTPVASLQLSIDWTKKVYFDSMDEKMRRTCDIMGRSIARLGILIDDVLDLARIESMPVDISATSPALVRELQEAIETVEPLYLERRISLEVDLPEEDLRVRMGKHRLIQIVVNLLGNAVRFAHTSVNLRVRASGAFVEMHVEDDGPGIPPEHLDAVFEPFVRIDDTGNPNEGSGLGLAIVQGLIRSHGGSIRAENRTEAGGGARFRIELPQAP